MNLRKWVETCDPSVLITIGDQWLSTAAGLEGLFTDYADAVTKVNGEFWEGQCADAAQTRAQADKRTMQTLADKLEGIANRAKAGYDEVNAPLLRARGALAEAVSRGYTINNATLALTHPDTNTTEQDRNALLELQSELNDAALSAVRADLAVRDALEGTRDGLRAAFVSTAALGVDQATTDGKQLAENPDELNPEQFQRLVESGQLTDEQQAALDAGNTATIPASQMEYLTQVSRSLDGKSPQEIEEIMDKLPPDAQRSLSNSLQILSKPDIAAGPVSADDTDLANSGRGGFTQLPQGIQDSLTRDDLVSKESNFGINETIKINGVADNQAIAKIASMSDEQYREGTDLDRKLLDVGAKYLEGQTAYNNSAHDFLGGTSLEIDGGDNAPFVTQHGLRISEDMFAAAGSDKAAVAELVTGPDGDKFIGNTLTHRWSDDGAAVSTLFDFNDSDATVEDWSNPTDVHEAERTGCIMSEVGQYIAGSGEGTDPGSRWKELTEMEAPYRDAGQLNPKLIQTLDSNIAPYAETLAGNPRDNLPGFDVPSVVATDGRAHTWLDPNGNGEYTGAANIFGLMHMTEGTSTELDGSALASMIRNQVEYGADPDVSGNTDHLATAGRLNALMDSGTFISNKAITGNEYLDAMNHYDQKSATYDTARTILTRGATEWSDPGGKATGDAFLSGGSRLKEMFIGPEPVPGKEVELTPPNFDQRNYESLSSMTTISPERQQAYPELFENGQLRSWKDIQTAPQHESLSADATALFNEVGRRDGHAEAFRNAYDQVTRSPEAG